MIWEKIGINKKIYTEIIKIFHKYPSIDKVLIFGSRARGDDTNVSDMDLCIYSDNSAKLEKIKVHNELESINTAIKFDLLIYNEIQPGKLKDNIDTEGFIIYEKGEKFMTKLRFSERFEEYKKALHRLQESLQIKEPDDLQIDGIIQRFEFCVELAWKTMKDYINMQMIEVRSPREAVKEGFSIGIIEDGDEWMEMLEARNITSHTYDSKDSRTIYNSIKDKYIKLLTNLYDKLTKRD